MILGRVRLGLAECRSILKSPHREERVNLLRAYLQIVRARLSGKQLGPECLSLMGYDVGYYDLYVLRELFLEVFCDAIYHADLSSDSPMIIDCGANIGISVLYFKWLFPKAQILAFEPGEKAFDMLARNVRQNRLEDIDLRRQALGIREGTAEFFVDPNIAGGTANSLLRNRFGKANVEQIEMVRLSTHVERPVDLLKLDVEGSEEQVLEDLVETGAIRNVRRCVLEYHRHIDERPGRFSELLRQIEDLGFTVTVEEPVPFALVPTRNANPMIHIEQDQPSK